MFALKNAMGKMVLLSHVLMGNWNNWTAIHWQLSGQNADGLLVLGSPLMLTASCPFFPHEANMDIHGVEGGIYSNPRKHMHMKKIETRDLSPIKKSGRSIFFGSLQLAIGWRGPRMFPVESLSWVRSGSRTDF